MRLKGTYIILVCLLLLTACNNAKYLTKDDSLYKGNKITLTDKTVSKKARSVLLSELSGTIRPKPNSKSLGMRLKLTMYNVAGKPKKNKGLRAWLRNKVGEPPVLASSFNIKSNKALLTNVLQNRGFFYSNVDIELVTKKKKTTAKITIATGGQYKINKSFFLADSTHICKDITDIQGATLLTPGSPYNLDLIKGERNRIENALKEEGYYYFKADYLIVRADTNIGNNKVNMYVTLKDDEVPDEAYKTYTINNVYIFPNYKILGTSSDTAKTNALEYDTYLIVDPKQKFKPKLFPPNMLFAKGDLYNRTDQNGSLSRLVNLGCFKFVKNRLSVSPLSDTMMDVYYYLTPYAKKSLRFQIGALTQNDNRAGSQASVSWLNRNTFKAAELLQIKLNGGFEAQYSGVVKEPNIYNVGAEVDLSFPHFAIPFVNIESPSFIAPKTFLKASYNYESQSDLLRINSYKLSFGYDWKENARKEHQFYPFNFTYVKTDTLGDASKLGILYGNLIFNGIIIGPTYEFTYNSQTGTNIKNDNFYFDGLIDLSGNILGLAEHANYTTHPQTIFGSTYAQYLKTQLDFRYYHNFTKVTSVASRIFVGLGYPYGNSYQLPNIKQFFSGGNSSLRGFPSRLVGPGTFNEKYLDGTNHYIQTLGDIKLESNLELRQNVYKFINAAAFVDAGNIWLYNNDPDYPGGKFTSNYYKELAVDMGIGLRFDFKVFLVRLDVAIPVREPWLPENERWVFNKINFGDPSWRSNNIVYNIAIGYPF